MSPLTQSPRVRKLAVLLGIASLGSTAAYGVGTQVGGGQAGAAGSTKSGPGRGPSSADLATLAGKLGVSTDKLKAAFAATRPAKPPSKPAAGTDPFATALAKELGVSADKLKAALDANRPSRPPQGGRPPAKGSKPDDSALAAALAKALDIDQATVQSALDKVHASHKADDAGRRKAQATALAKQLDLPVATVESALSSWHPAGQGPGGHGGPGGPGGPRPPMG
jgi:hypothetical protein